jgi:NADPH:quinone reductase-like Zn-dependent oxidoreductase
VRAAIYRSYGPPERVVRIEEVDAPAPGEGEVLVAVRAVSINPLDVHLMKGQPLVARLAFGLFKPKLGRPGVDLAGIVEAVGAGVTRFRPGDAVFGVSRAALAELACTTEKRLAAKPACVSFAQAAAVPIAGFTALQGLRKAQVAAGQAVLINGAAGGVGSFAVQIAKSLGAEVTAVCSARNLDLVRSIGADHAIAYDREDFTRGAARYDLIFDLVTNHGFSSLRRVLTPGGMVVAGGLGGQGTGRWAARLFGGLLAARFTRERMALLMAKGNAEDLQTLADMMAAGTLTPAIESCYRLEAAAAAIGEVGTGHARGKVVVEVGDPE